MSDGLRTTTQWAAVTTHKGSTKVPPQNCVRPRYVSSIACHGHEFTAASVPPTIRAWVNGRDPQSPKWVRNPSTSNTKEDIKSNFSSYKTITEYNRLVIFFLFICLFFTSECTVKKKLYYLRRQRSVTVFYNVPRFKKRSCRVFYNILATSVTNNFPLMNLLTQKLLACLF